METKYELTLDGELATDDGELPRNCTLGQWFILLLLRNVPYTAPQLMWQMPSSIDCTPAGLLKALKRLKQQGLITDSRDPEVEAKRMRKIERKLEPSS